VCIKQKRGTIRCVHPDTRTFEEIAGREESRGRNEKVKRTPGAVVVKNLQSVEGPARLDSQGFTNSGRQLAVPTEFSMVALPICRSSGYNLVNTTV